MNPTFLDCLDYLDLGQALLPAPCSGFLPNIRPDHWHPNF